MRHSYAFLMFLSLLIPASVTWADVVYMKNGDRISGEVVRMSGKKLILRTSYAGEIDIQWTEVQAFTTEQPVRLYLKESEMKRGVVETKESGEQVLIVEEAAAGTPFDLASVDYINPPKHVSGEGFTWSGNVNVGFKNERGNTDKDEYHLDGELRVRGKGVRYRLYGEFERETSNNRTTKSKWKGIGEYNRDLRGKWYLFANLFSEGDRKKDLDVRATLSAGPGYRIFDGEDLNLSLELGPGVTVERWDSDDREDDEYPVARFGVNYDQYVYRRLVQLFHRQNTLWNLETTSDYVFTSQTGVNFDLTKHVRSTLRFDYEYDNEAPRDRKKKDSKVLATVGYKW